MPHLIIEYSTDAFDDARVGALVDSVFEATVNSALFETDHIKVRALAVDHYRLGTQGEGFVCAQCRIHAGRTAAQKKQLSEALVGAIRAQNPALSVVTAEVIEMDRGSYSRYSHD